MAVIVDATCITANVVQLPRKTLEHANREIVPLERIRGKRCSGIGVDMLLLHKRLTIPIGVQHPHTGTMLS